MRTFFLSLDWVTNFGSISSVTSANPERLVCIQSIWAGGGVARAWKVVFVWDVRPLSNFSLINSRPHGLGPSHLVVVELRECELAGSINRLREHLRGPKSDLRRRECRA